MDRAQLNNAIAQELRDNLLPFWRHRSIDTSRGGFIAEMSCNGSVIDDAPRGLILNSRLLWTFSALYRHLGHQRDLELAQRARHELETRFRDREHGGYCWLVGAGGECLETTKKTYGQAFSIYALSDYFLATGDETALSSARELFALIERYAHDPEHGGYFEGCSRQWQALTALRLGEEDLPAAKSMNTHLHLLEAYTNLYRAWPVADVAARLRELLSLFDCHILERRDNRSRNHLHHYFDKSWTTLPSFYTYGHDIEAGWLLCEAAEVLGDQEIIRHWRRCALEIAETTLAEGIDSTGALAYAGKDGEMIDAKLDWWCQAEAVTGLWHAYQLSSDRAFATASLRVWETIQRCFIDRVNGEWFQRILADGTVDEQAAKVSAWKGPYHNVRMCLEMARRTGSTKG
jgi:mannobiose 2-epimerase